MHMCRWTISAKAPQASCTIPGFRCGCLLAPVADALGPAPPSGLAWRLMASVADHQLPFAWLRKLPATFCSSLPTRLQATSTLSSK